MRLNGLFWGFATLVFFSQVMTFADLSAPDATDTGIMSVSRATQSTSTLNTSQRIDILEQKYNVLKASSDQVSQDLTSLLLSISGMGQAVTIHNNGASSGSASGAGSTPQTSANSLAVNTSTSPSDGDDKASWIGRADDLRRLNVHYIYNADKSEYSDIDGGLTKFSNSIDKAFAGDPSNTSLRTAMESSYYNVINKMVLGHGRSNTDFSPFLIQKTKAFVGTKSQIDLLAMQYDDLCKQNVSGIGNHKMPCFSSTKPSDNTGVSAMTADGQMIYFTSEGECYWLSQYIDSGGVDNGLPTNPNDTQNNSYFGSNDQTDSTSTSGQSSSGSSSKSKSKNQAKQKANTKKTKTSSVSTRTSSGRTSATKF